MKVLIEPTDARTERALELFSAFVEDDEQATTKDQHIAVFNAYSKELALMGFAITSNIARPSDYFLEDMTIDPLTRCITIAVALSDVEVFELMGNYGGNYGQLPRRNMEWRPESAMESRGRRGRGRR